MDEDDDEEEVEEGDDDDDEVEEGEADDAFTWEPSEENGILTSNVRKYVVPKINFNATSYTQLIDLRGTGITEPWCVQELQKMLKTPVPKVWARYMMCTMREKHQRDFWTNRISARMTYSWPKMVKNGQI